MENESDELSDNAELFDPCDASDGQMLSRRRYRLCKPQESQVLACDWIESPQNDTMYCTNILSHFHKKFRSNFDYIMTYGNYSESDNQSHDERTTLSGLSPKYDDFEFVENIELHHMNNYILPGKKEMGEGHLFEAVQLATPSWCDQCGQFIWGISKQCLRCKYCKYTCHLECRQEIVLDCNFDQDNDVDDSNFNKSIFPTFLDHLDETDSGYHTGDHSLLEKAKQLEKIDGERTLCRAELKKSIDEFNLNKYGLQITLVDDASSVKKSTQSENIMGNENFFQGFIRVFMNLMRPISMSLNRPLSIYDALSKEEKKQIGESSTQSFYLPKDTSKVIHISSDTSTQEVITILLQKYNITDNPHKFALYEKTSEIDDHSRMRRITNNEFPLEICLLWSSEGLQNHRFVLQENDTQEVVWDAFSVPELENFLKILDREEKEYVEQIKAKYNLLHIQISHQCSTLLENERQSQSSSLGVNKITDNKEKTIKITNDGQAEVFV